MREFVSFTAYASDRPSARPTTQWQEIASAALRPYGPKEINPSPYGMVISFEFDYYPEGLDAVVGQLRRQHISASFSVRHQYTAAERRAAELLILGGEGVVNSVEGTLRWEEVSICPFCDCRTDDWQFEPLRIVEQPQGAVLACVGHWPLVCSAELAAALRQAEVTGLELVPVGPDRPVQWYGMRATHQLPPVAVPPTRLPRDRDLTPQCAADHLWKGSDSSQLAYRRQELDLADFNHTYEYSGDRHSAIRYVVISQRVYGLLRELVVKRLSCAPIRFVD